MAISANAVTVQWSASSSVSLTTGTPTQTSDNQDVTAADCPTVTLELKADNAGTPASGDTVDFYVSRSVDGTDYDTAENYLFLATLDTYTPSADPSIKVVSFSVVGCTDWKLVSTSNASSNSITVSAAGYELDLE